MIYACKICKYLFDGNPDVKQCPDCGKMAVRLATPKEIEEYKCNHSGEDFGELGGNPFER